jgi:hypothetical protein
MATLEDAMTKARPHSQGFSGDFDPTDFFDPPERELTPEEEKALLDEWFADPEFEAYVMEKVQESLDDPRPPVPMAEVRERMERKFAAARFKYGQ